MIQISLNDIRNLAEGKMFRQGVKLHQKQTIQNISTYDNRIVGYIFDEDNFTTNESSIFIDVQTETPNDYHCDCHTYKKHRICPHIIALLLEILYTKEKLDFSFHTHLTTNLINEFTSVLVDTVEIIEKDIVQLIPIIHLNDDIRLGLKIGMDQTYIIKNITGFLDIYKEKTMNFGKHYTYLPDEHTFSKTSLKIIDIIQEFTDLAKSMNGFVDDYIFQGQVNLPQAYWLRILKLLKYHPFQLKINSEYFHQDKILRELKMNFDVIERNSIIHITSPHKVYPLFKGKPYVVIDHELFIIPEEQQAYIDVVYKALKENEYDISIEKSFKHNFASSILPILKKLGNVNLGPTINKTLYTDTLVAEIFLEEYQNTIKGSIIFNYGDYQLHMPPKDESQIPDHITIIQDLQKETKILNLLKSANCVFDMTEGFFSFTDEAFLYDFIYVILPELQEEATIYYSDNFKEIHLQHNQGFQGNIALGPSGILDFTFEIDGVSENEVSNVIKAMKENQKYYRLTNGQFLPLEEQQFQRMDQLLNRLNLYDQAMEDNHLMIPLSNAFTLEHLLKKGNYKAFHKSRAFKQLLDDINDPTDIEMSIPDQLLGTLRPYQETGFKWLKALNHYGLGGILADDMGLGKTIQTIALLLASHTGRPSIVIGPTSLIYNWAAEIARFGPSLKYCIITGDKNKRNQLIMNELKNYDVIITSYGTAKRDIEHYQHIEFEYCILDEAQHIKNHLSMNALAVKLIHARTKLALTGTPIENNISELWSIFDFVMPGFLGSHKNFFNHYEKPIIKDSNHKLLNQLIGQISPFILRRLKKDVLLELPPKIETNMYTDLNHEQKALYLAILEQTKATLADQTKNNNTMQIFAALTKLRQVCCHPSLVDSSSGASSSKLDMLNEIIQDARESGHRMLIFSTFTSMLQIIRGLLDEQGIDYFYLDGKTKAEDRLKLTKSFNDGERDLCLISLKAGGTGLNLTGADMVIHYDPWWNLAAEDQATDRAYRIGQNKSVQVIKLLTTGTIEEKIFKLQGQKKSLIDSVIKPGETFINHLNENELLKLFKD